MYYELHNNWEFQDLGDFWTFLNFFQLVSGLPISTHLYEIMSPKATIDNSYRLMDPYLVGVEPITFRRGHFLDEKTRFLEIIWCQHTTASIMKRLAHKSSI